MRKNYHTENKSFLIYKDWEEYLETLTDEEVGKLFRALFAYAKRGEETPFDGALRMLFTMIKNTIERDGKKWEDICEARSEGRRSSEKTKVTKDAEVTKVPDTEKDTETDREKAADTEKEPPSEGRFACGSTAKKRKKDCADAEHSYDLEKLIEHAMNTVPNLTVPKS